MRPPAPIRRLLLIAPLLLAACAVPPPGGGGSARVDPDAPVKVALMVPTGSTDADREALGRSLVNAARMAAGDLAGVSVEIAVYPTAGRAEVAAAAARTAIDEGAQVILGPLFADAARAAAPVAADAGLQVLSLSNTPDIAGGNLWVLGTTFDTVARRVVGHAAGQGVGELAIVHPTMRKAPRPAPRRCAPRGRPACRSRSRRPIRFRSRASPGPRPASPRTCAPPRRRR